MSRVVTLVGGPADGSEYYISDDRLLLVISQAVILPRLHVLLEHADKLGVATVEHQYAVHRTQPFAVYVPPRVESEDA